jgi:hypothetical protein
VSRPRAFSQVLAHADCFNAQDAEPTRRLVEGFLKLVAAVPVFPSSIGLSSKILGD